MDAKLYYGQPPEHDHSKPVERPEPKPSPSPGPFAEHCVCTNLGEDGTRVHSPLPHRHHLRFYSLEKLRTHSCQNHLQFYLKSGWWPVTNEKPAMVCAYCTCNAPMPNDTICEACAMAYDGLQAPKNDAVRIKDEGLCLNRNDVQGCTHFTQPGENLCKFCQNYMKLSSLGGKAAKATQNLKPHRSRIRLIHTSARPCNITAKCAGQMTAHVRRFNMEMLPELVWVCAVCKKQKLAERTTAIPDKEVVSPEVLANMLNEGGIDVSAVGEPTDLTDLAGHARGMLDSTDL